MVTDDDRDYMWAEYATDPRMKANIGIRRRLAPLLDNDTNRMELFTALLLSLPGSPVLYYGDEIGMGDNIWLGDRDGVRTPMQWTPDRNAGFSVATPGRLHLPVIQDPVFGYQARQCRSRAGQLLLAAALDPADDPRAQAASRASASATSSTSADPTRRCSPTCASTPSPRRTAQATDTVLCVNNLSRFPQPVELDLRRWEGVVPIELLGGVRFPEIGELPYLLTLGGYGFYWIRLPDRREVTPMRLEQSRRDALAAFLAEARWFGGKGRDFEVADVPRRSPCSDGVDTMLVTIWYAAACTDARDARLYQVPARVLRPSRRSASATP